jgi:hypothetical protein
MARGLQTRDAEMTLTQILDNSTEDRREVIALTD